MSNPLPTIFGTSQQVEYGFTRTVSCSTTVNTFVSGAEQRWANRLTLTKFTVPLALLRQADRNHELTTFTTAKGRFGQNITLTLGDTTYSNLTFDSDLLSFTNSKPNIYDTQIVLHQTQNPGDSIPSVTATYPTLSFNAVAEMPFTDGTEFFTSVVDQPVGVRYGWAWFDAGLTNFPTGPLRYWKIQYSLLNDTDVATLETFFRGMQGRLTTFDFGCPVDSTVYHNCRFDSDDLEIRYLAPNQSSTVVTLRETLAG